MCINQRTIVNRRYVKLAGSASRAEALFRDAKDLYLSVDCGRCLPCQKKRATYWRQRLIDEYKYLVASNPDKKKRVFFVTLTIAPQYYKRDVRHAYTLIKKFRERYRKRYGTSLRYWICSEYGEKRGRLHFHAIFFDPLFDATLLPDLWQYGRCDMSVVGDSPKNPNNDPDKGIAYVTKYITKYVDKWFINWDERSFIWCSPGIGLKYCFDNKNRSFHSLNGGLFFRTDDTGQYPVALPRYYVSKLFSPYDLYKRSIEYMNRLHEPISFPMKVGALVFDSFIPYCEFIYSIGGSISLNPYQLAKMQDDEIMCYFKYN